MFPFSYLGIEGVPRTTADSLVQEKVRKELFKKKMDEKTAISSLIMCGMMLNEFTIQYPNSVQSEMIQILGQKTRSKYGGNDVVLDLQESINQATFNKPMKPGFRYPPSSTTTYSAKKAPKKNGFIDFKPFRNPNNAAYVPPGWCIWHFRLGACKKGAKCPHKHTVWTAAEVEAAKKK